MSARVGGRFAPAPLPHVDLPTLTRPQVVDENGLELTDEQIEALAAAAVATSEEPPEEMEVEENEEDIQVEASETPATPLLGLADSLVLQYSLLQTRQQHIKNLLPLMFSHPPVPGHNKPRLRLPPRSGFVFPTPPPLPQPLPSHEYHGPANKEKKSKGTEGDTEGGDADEEKEKRKYKRQKNDAPSWPAHEIECIARVTLEVGPVSFPNTELWIGKFVAPRAGAASTVRGRPKGMPREKRPSTDAPPKPPKPPKAPKRVKQEPVPRPMPTPTTIPPRPPAPAAPTSVPPRPPAVGNYASRSDIPQSLIQRVNAAASQHQWLSILIHKAARNIATKEELTKLGRVVARLGRGEGVGEGPEMPGQPLGPSTEGLLPHVRPTAGPSRPPATGPRPPVSAAAGPSRPAGTGSLAPPLPPAATPSRPPTSTAPLAVRPPPARPPPASVSTRPAVPGFSTKPSSADQPDSSDSDLSDEDVDMGGRPQVGGGPPGSSDPTAKPATTVIEPTVAQPGQSPATPVSAPSTVQTTAPAAGTAGISASSQQTPVRPPVPPSGQPVTPATTPQIGSSLAPPLPISRPPAATPSAYPYYRPPAVGPYRPPGSNTIMVPMSAPPPPDYPLPPPFLLIAFKDAPTEKFLVPLGPHSFISRVGDSSEPAKVSPPPDPTPAPEVTVKDEPLPAGKKRTRASLAKPIATPEPEPQPAKEPTPAPPPKKDLYADLPSVPGMHPKKGTVLLSTFIPHEQWNRPDWPTLSKRLPFGNPEFVDKLKGKVKPGPETPSKGKGKAPVSPRSPGRSLRHVEDKQLPREHIVNLAAEPFLPAGPLEPITLRFSGLTDDLWRRVKGVVDQVERVELEAIAKELNPPAPAASSPATVTATPAPVPVPAATTTAATVPPGPPAPPTTTPNPPTPADKPPDPASKPTIPITQAVRETYLTRKKTAFSNLLSRVGPRLFPRFRVENRAATLADAVSDKWAPRPYHLTTRPLYTSAAADEDVTGTGTPALEIDFEEPDLDIGRKKRRPESSVTFEMPVSLDALDERVEAGAARGLARRGRGRGRGTVIVRKFRRGTVGATCEGCAKVGLKVWRRGPGGRGTLCNACGDSFIAGSLGAKDLLAPGAAKPAGEGGKVEEGKEGDEGEGDGEGEGEDGEEQGGEDQGGEEQDGEVAQNGGDKEHKEQGGEKGEDGGESGAVEGEKDEGSKGVDNDGAQAMAGTATEPVTVSEEKEPPVRSESQPVNDSQSNNAQPTTTAMDVDLN